MRTGTVPKTIHLISAARIFAIPVETPGVKGVVIGKVRSFQRAKARSFTIRSAIAGKILQLPGSHESFFIAGCFYNSDEKLLFLSNYHQRQRCPAAPHLMTVHQFQRHLLDSCS
jgi:hypothetical protein